MDIRERIIEGANKLFMEHGVRQVTMDMIAQSLGISKRTIYENFKDKEDLLSNLIFNSVIQHKKRSIEILGESKNVIDALYNITVYHKESMRSINPLFFEDMKKYHSDIYAKIFSNKEVRNYELTYTILKRGQNEGIFSKEIDLEVANLFIHYLMDFFKHAECEFECDDKRIFRSVHLPYLRGICTEKGRELLTQLIMKEKKT
jgi:TetR/AcrR family transcriptional regulator, cholesterol catabolism regulator